jgi:ribose transport system ATP-binding protein
MSPQATTHKLVSMAGIDKSFPGVHALKGARFDLVKGEVHALMGENGAGKSTLMKVLAGIYPCDRGAILIEGNPVSPASPREAQELGIGIIHQELSLMPDLTAAQNILIGREPRRAAGLLLDEKALNRRAGEILRAMGLVLDPATPVSTLTIARSRWWRSPRRCPIARASSSWTSRLPHSTRWRSQSCSPSSAS